MTAPSARHGLTPTTHTIEMAQVDDLNLRLQNTRSPVITAGDLGMSGESLPNGAPSRLVPQAVLTKVSWQGNPEFPEIHGHFKGPDGAETADLHTAALQQISRRLLLRQRWGV